MQIRSKMKCHESLKFHYHVVEYAFLIQNICSIKTHPHIKQARATQSLVKLHMTRNAPSEKLDFSIPCCNILLTDSEYINSFEMP